MFLKRTSRARVRAARLAIRAALKGVAMLPAMIAVLLKLGEKAAAAATAGSAGAAVSGGYGLLQPLLRPAL